ncbi:MAG: type II secretion system F family protein [Butyricicoccaceae bacterium]
MKMEYVAVDAEGKKVKGVIDAESESNAIYYIRSQDLSPLVIRPYKEKAAHFWEIEIMEPDVHKLKMKKKDMVRFSEKMAIMLKAGVSLSMAMDVLIASEKNRRYRKIYKTILMDLYGGLSLADSMRTFDAFPEMIVNMVASGEKNGKLDWSFTRIAEMYEKEMALNGKILSAFSYPAFLAVLLVALFVVMTVVVLPKFSTMYQNFDAELPAITQFLLDVSNFLRAYGIYILGALIVVGLLLFILLKSSKGFGRAFSRMALKLPAYGRLTVVGNTSSFSRVAAALLQSGVEVVESVKVAATVVKNKYIRSSVERALGEVEQGSTINLALSKLHIFDTLFISMLQIGEESSMLPETFQKMADMYEQDSNEASKKLTALLEPIMTLAIGLMIALMVVAIILPMFNMYTVILG